MPDRAPAQLDAAATSRLRRLNLVVGSAHALQSASLMVVLIAMLAGVSELGVLGPVRRALDALAGARRWSAPG